MPFSSLQVLANLTCNTQATTSLVLKSSLLTWIELQLLNSKEDEGVEWIKILENILTVVDPTKLESSTNGEWRSVICRCLSLLLANLRACKFSRHFSKRFLTRHDLSQQLHYLFYR